MSEIRRHDKTNLRNTIALGATIITRRRRATPRDARTRTNADMTTDARGERAALLGRDVSSTPRANADAAVLDVERGDEKKTNESASDVRHPSRVKGSGFRFFFFFSFFFSSRGSLVFPIDVYSHHLWPYWP